MNVLLYNAGADTGGVLASIVRAFRGVEGWNVRSLVSSPNYIGYEADIEYSREAVSEWWQWADVIHLHHNFRSANVALRRNGRLRHKPYVMEYHGEGFREDPNSHLRELRRHRAIGVVSTLDLYLLSPADLEWLPVPVNVDRLLRMRQVDDPKRILIAHAPTNRGIKSTDEFEKACKRLQSEGFPVEYDIIEHRPWTECLERKARADIYFDQVILGYGCNALEAWGMGIPVIAGAADETLDEMERRFGYLPFYHATQETIYDALRELVESPELRAEYGRIGHEYVRRFHDEPVVVEQLKRLYRRAMGESMEEAA